jgi:hypothetical protein
MSYKESFSTEFCSESERILLNFTRIHIAEGFKFFVQATGSQSQTDTFELKKEKFGNWRIVQPAPAWVNEAEEQLVELIQAHTAEEKDFQPASSCPQTLTDYHCVDLPIQPPADTVLLLQKQWKRL